MIEEKLIVLPQSFAIYFWFGSTAFVIDRRSDQSIKTVIHVIEETIEMSTTYRLLHKKIIQ
jgi:hypothetical protein